MTEPLEYPYAAREQAAEPAAEPEPEPEPAAPAEPGFEPAAEAEPLPEPELEPEREAEPEGEPLLRAPDQHAGGELEIPEGYGVFEGVPSGTRRGVAVVVARFNAEITSRLLASALDELDRSGVAREAITIVPV